MPVGRSSAPARSASKARAAWLDSVGKAANVAGAKKSTRPRLRCLPAIQGALQKSPIDATVTVSGYEGSELLVARLLIEAGARVPYVGTACPKTDWSADDRDWLEAHGCHVQYRASLEQDLAAMRDVDPDLALGTTPLVQAAKEEGRPAVYFTNIVSARPLFGPAGAGALSAIVSSQAKGKQRFQKMVDFFSQSGRRGAAAKTWSQSGNGTSFRCCRGVRARGTPSQQAGVRQVRQDAAGLRVARRWRTQSTDSNVPVGN